MLHDSLRSVDNTRSTCAPIPKSWIRPWSYSKTAVHHGINVMTQYFLLSLWSFGRISYTFSQHSCRLLSHLELPQRIAETGKDGPLAHTTAAALVVG